MSGTKIETRVDEKSAEFEKNSRLMVDRLTEIVEPSDHLVLVRQRCRQTVRFRAQITNAVISLIDPAHGPYVHENWFWHVRGTLQDKTKSFVPSPFGFTSVVTV